VLKTFDPAEMTRPMREDLVRAGFQELRTSDEVDRVLGERKGPVLVFVNSVCGCAAGSARPGVIAAVEGLAHVPKLTTVFAGQDHEATERARGYFPGIPPSSPSVFLLKDGAMVFSLERRQIEGRSPDFVAAELRKVLQG
jgi:putative YphP/YqiW family bacilliredoxin